MIVKAVFAGSEKNSLSKVTRHIAELGLGGQVNILGYVPDDDIIGLYKNARALVMPTFFGPTNIPPLEAFCLGVPVACSGIYAMSEQVGDAALLFDPKRSEDIAEKVGRLWTEGELRRALAEKGRERMRDLTFDRYVTRWEDILGAALRSTDIRHTGQSKRIRRALNHEPARCA
jgi:glycosyltransferase involved in cell wall biosynthesis